MTTYGICFLIFLPGVISLIIDVMVWIIRDDCQKRPRPPRQTPGDDVIGRVTV